MTRVARVRTRAPSYSGGTIEYFNDGAAAGSSAGDDFSAYYDICSDSHGQPISDSGFVSDQFEGQFPSVSGTLKSSVIYNPDEAHLNVVARLPGSLWNTGPLSAPSGWMLDLVAGTNPSRPVLNLPELVEDIVDLPKAVKNLGDILTNPGNHLKPKGLAGEYLGVQFGWLPVIDDLQKLLDFQSYAIKRSKELNQLYSGAGLSRSMQIRSDTQATTDTVIAASVGAAQARHTRSYVLERKQWASIRWKPTAPPPYHPDDKSLNTFATKLVLGATPEAMLNGIWKVIPWTWLLGWFTNLGKYTLAHSWTVPADHGTGCLMSQSTVTCSSASAIAFLGASGTSLSHSGSATRTQKTRVVASSVTVGANMPFLDTFRLSILSALYVQRFFGR